MAASVDRMWVRREIDTFNRSPALPTTDSLDALADRILQHLRLPKTGRPQLVQHLSVSMDEGDKIVTDANEILALFDGTSTPAGVVEALLNEDGKLPPVQELFRIFSKINQDLASNIGKDDSQPVDFSDVEFYADQISAMWEDTVNDWEKIWAAAVHLRDYAKSQNYVLPGRPSADIDARRLAARVNRNGPVTKMIRGVKMKMTPGGTWTRAE